MAVGNSPESDSVLLRQQLAALQSENAALNAENERLTRVEDHFKWLLENTPVVIYELDLSGGAFAATIVSNNVEQQFGYPLAEALAENWWGSNIHPEDRQGAFASSASIFQHESISHEYRFETKSGSYIWVYDCLRQLKDESGKVTRAIGAWMDITERKQIEELLRDKNRELERAKYDAEAASSAKGEFLANMSHEIRTPMNGVLGMLGILLDRPLPERERDYVETARRSGQALLDIINDILDLSKIEAGHMSLEPVPFDLRSTFEDVLDQFSSQVHSPDVELIVDYREGTPARVIGDPGRVRQLLINLIGNAAKFTEEGHILVTAECKRRQAEALLLEITIEDTGIGIPVAQQELIFSKFRQVDGSTTRTGAGTGLGLAICRELAALMGGELGVRSVEGEGSTFWFTMQLQADVDAGPEARPSASLSRSRVLIVDDHPVSARILAAQFRSWNISAEICVSGNKALGRLSAARHDGVPFDIAILGHHMPQTHYLDIAQGIRREPEHDPTMLLLLTSVRVEPDVAALERLGVDAHLTKPVHQSRLLDALTTAWAARGGSESSSPSPRRRESSAALESVVRGRVLVVEDNAVNQKVALLMLEMLGCSVDVAANGLEAVELSAIGEYDLIFMDVHMPEMDGYEATAAIREREAGDDARIPIIAMTASAMVGDRERCLAAGMDGYVSKPVDRDRLADALTKFLSQSANPCRASSRR